MKKNNVIEEDSELDTSETKYDENEEISLIGQYRLLDPISKTKYGVVYRVENTQQQVFALKMVFENQDKANHFEIMQYLQKNIRHEFIMKVHEVIKDTNGHHFVMDYYQDQDLQQYILLKQKKCISEEIALTIFKKMAIAQQVLHDNLIVHCELNPRNILLVGQDPKIGDFGNAVFIQNQTSMLTSALGEFHYAAPEILALEPFSYQCDIWSLGCILFFMLFGQNPFTKVSQQATMLENIKKMYIDQKQLNLELIFQERLIKQPQKLQPSTIDLLNRLLCLEGEQRIDYEEILADPAIVGIDSRKSLPPKLQLHRALNTLKLISYTTLEKQKQFVNSIIEGLHSSDTDFFQKAIMRYSFFIDIYEIINNLNKNDLETIPIVERRTFNFFMVQMILYFSKSILFFIEQQSNQGKENIKRMEKLEQISLFIKNDTEKWNSVFLDSLQAVNEVQFMVKHTEITQGFHDQIQVNSTSIQNLSQVPNDIIQPFRGCVLMMVKFMKEHAEYLSLQADQKGKHKNIRDEKIQSLNEMETMAQSQQLGKIYAKLDQMVDSTRQHEIKRTQHKSHSLAKIQLNDEPKIQSVTRVKQHMNTTLHQFHSPTSASSKPFHEWVPPSFKEIQIKKLEAAQFMQYSLRCLICVCANRIFELKNAKINLFQYESAFQKSGKPDSEYYHYFSEWVSSLDYTRSMILINYLMMLNFPQLADFVFNFLYESVQKF